jgi:hypothetical protein
MGNPALKIAMGIWHYNEDPDKAARMISRTGDLPICTSLADASIAARINTAPKPLFPSRWMSRRSWWLSLAIRRREERKISLFAHAFRVCRSIASGEMRRQDIATHCGRE